MLRCLQTTIDNCHRLNARRFQRLGGLRKKEKEVWVIRVSKIIFVFAAMHTFDYTLFM